MYIWNHSDVHLHTNFSKKFKNFFPISRIDFSSINRAHTIVVAHDVYLCDTKISPNLRSKMLKKVLKIREEVPLENFQFCSFSGARIYIIQKVLIFCWFFCNEATFQQPVIKSSNWFVRISEELALGNNLGLFITLQVLWFLLRLHCGWWGYIAMYSLYVSNGSNTSNDFPFKSSSLFINTHRFKTLVYTISFK